MASRSWFRFLGVVCAGVILAFAAAALYGLLLPESEASDTEMRGTVVPVERSLTPSYPVTTVLPLGRLLSTDKSAPEGGKSTFVWAPLRLVIHGVKIISGESVGFRVYVNKPDANTETPTTDPHYVTSVAFFPSRPSEQPPSNYVVDLSRSLSSLAASGMLATDKPLSVTLVAIPAEETPKEIPVRIEIQSVALERITS